jgi:hypothetical protein
MVAEEVKLAACYLLGLFSDIEEGGRTLIRILGELLWTTQRYTSENSIVYSHLGENVKSDILAYRHVENVEKHHVQSPILNINLKRDIYFI